MLRRFVIFRIDGLCVLFLVLFHSLTIFLLLLRWSQLLLLVMFVLILSLDIVDIFLSRTIVIFRINSLWMAPFALLSAALLTPLEITVSFLHFFNDFFGIVAHFTDFPGCFTLSSFAFELFLRMHQSVPICSVLEKLLWLDFFLKRLQVIICFFCRIMTWLIVVIMVF